MNEHSLGMTLNRMYSDAPDGYKVASIHFFGVKYASFIQENHLSVREIIKASGLNASYATEISKGIKLSKYVVPK